MKWNKRAKLTATATSALLFTLLLASCSNDNNNNNSANLPVNNQTQQVQTNEDTDDVSTDNGSSPDSSSPDSNSELTKPEQTPVEQDKTVYEVTGHYVGAIDNNSIEVEVDGKPIVFQLSDAFDFVISDFAEHSKVTIKYTEEKIDGNYVQNIVTAISNAK